MVNTTVTPTGAPTTISSGAYLIPTFCLAWYIFIILVSAIGYVRIIWKYSSPPPPPISTTTLPADKVPHVTILRPVKDLEPHLSECLSATFHLTYPRDRLTIYFCIASRSDPAHALISRLAAEHAAEFDVRVLVEEEDPYLTGPTKKISLGPNPKIRNLSRGYREAKGDIIWIIDCNTWVGRGVAGRMVDTLCGFTASGEGMKYKFVHQLPLVVDTTGEDDIRERSRLEGSSLLMNGNSFGNPPYPRSSISPTISCGGRLEELFFSSSHAKFYTAINTVLVAPCCVGKSNMFRRSHLNYLTTMMSPGNPRPGIDFFSDNICEDHLIGDLLWYKKVPEEEAGETWGKHALVLGDPCIQPMARMSVWEYTARRVRWLRVRKFTVTLATLVEPGTESFVASLCVAYGATAIPFFNSSLHIPQTWFAFAGLWLLSVILWGVVDRTLYVVLQSGRSIEIDEHTPGFAKKSHTRTFWAWVLAWLGRESLAFPIWAWAVFGGTTVVWRGRTFWVGMDMRVHEVRGFKAALADNFGMAVEESLSVCEPKHNPRASAQSPGDTPDEESRSPGDTEPKLQPSSGTVDSDGSPQPGEDVPPLPNEAPPSTAEEDDGWQALWDQNVQAYYFYNSHTGVTTWTNPRVPEASSAVDTPGVGNYDRIPHSGDDESDNREPQKPRPHGGYDPSIHGDYDPTAPYAQLHEETASGVSNAESSDPNTIYTAAGAFNRFTGKWQPLDITPELHNDENKSRRQMSAFFDVDAAANSHDGRSLKAERSGRKLTKKELKAFKEKRREKKEEKRRAWLRD